jgi:adenylate cyclase, class 2
MGKKNLEIEVKIKVTDLAAIEHKLKAAGASLKAARVFERNVRYDDAQITLSSAGRVLRLREDTRVRLTYKEPHPSSTDKAWTRTELEVTISDFETMDLLLQKLGFHTAWIYEKYRTTYEFKECEVVLDEMPFGPFIEIEGDSECIDKALTALDMIAARRINTSYSDLFFRLKARLGLPFRDLTFENFKTVTVPSEVFN